MPKRKCQTADAADASSCPVRGQQGIEEDNDNLPEQPSGVYDPAEGFQDDMLEDEARKVHHQLFNHPF